MSRTRKITDIAIFIAIGVVINMAAFPPFAILGRVSLVYGFCYLAGIFLGPFSGMFAAMVADLLGWLMIGGPFVPQIMLTNGLMALLSGLFYKHLKFKRKSLTIIPSAVISFIFLTLGLSAWGEAAIIFNVYPYTLAKIIGSALDLESSYLMVAISKAITQPFWIIINIVLSMVIIERVTIAREQFASSLECFKAEVEGSKSKN